MTQKSQKQWAQKEVEGSVYNGFILKITQKSWGDTLFPWNSLPVFFFAEVCRYVESESKTSDPEDKWVDFLGKNRQQRRYVLEDSLNNQEKILLKQKQFRAEAQMIELLCDTILTETNSSQELKLSSSALHRKDCGF